MLVARSSDQALGSALRDHPEFAADVFPKLFDQVWHDFTKAEAWEVFPETEPVIKVHVHMSQAVLRV